MGFARKHETDTMHCIAVTRTRTPTRLMTIRNTTSHLLLLVTCTDITRNEIPGLIKPSTMRRRPPHGASARPPHPASARLKPPPPPPASRYLGQPYAASTSAASAHFTPPPTASAPPAASSLTPPDQSQLRLSSSGTTKGLITRHYRSNVLGAARLFHARPNMSRCSLGYQNRSSAYPPSARSPPCTAAVIDTPMSPPPPLPSLYTEQEGHSEQALEP